MKSRIRKIANFLAFNLLFFALYLNFIHADAQPSAGFDALPDANTGAFSTTALTKDEADKKVTVPAETGKAQNN